jgi:N-acetyl-anhydromuramyl-L-alanine amidase AmpD
VQLITAGFSAADKKGWVADYGVKRTLESIVWHDMEGWLAGAISRWNSGAAGAHLCVLRDGQIVLTCRIEDVAWHAGTDNNPNGGTYGRTPFWRAHNINPHSIGVELEGFAVTGYTAAQSMAVRKIANWATNKLGIVREHTFDTIKGHHSHGELSSSRSDPGVLFRWDWVL